MATLDFEVHLDIDEIVEILKKQGWRPEKHARWLRTDAWPHRIYCSSCFMTFIRNDEFLRLDDIPHDYCSYCGARMDEEDDHDDHL